MTYLEIASMAMDEFETEKNLTPVSGTVAEDGVMSGIKNMFKGNGAASAKPKGEAAQAAATAQKAPGDQMMDLDAHDKAKHKKHGGFHPELGDTCIYRDKMAEAMVKMGTLKEGSPLAQKLGEHAIKAGKEAAATSQKEGTEKEPELEEIRQLNAKRKSLRGNRDSEEYKQAEAALNEKRDAYLKKKLGEAECGAVDKLGELAQKPTFMGRVKAFVDKLRGKQKEAEAAGKEDPLSPAQETAVEKIEEKMEESGGIETDASKNPESESGEHKEAGTEETAAPVEMTPVTEEENKKANAEVEYGLMNERLNAAGGGDIGNSSDDPNAKVHSIRTYKYNPDEKTTSEIVNEVGEIQQNEGESDEDFQQRLDNAVGNALRMLSDNTAVSPEEFTAAAQEINKKAHELQQGIDDRKAAAEEAEKNRRKSRQELSDNVASAEQAYEDAVSQGKSEEEIAEVQKKLEEAKKTLDDRKASPDRQDLLEDLNEARNNLNNARSELERLNATDAEGKKVGSEKEIKAAEEAVAEAEAKVESAKDDFHNYKKPVENDASVAPEDNPDDPYISSSEFGEFLNEYNINGQHYVDVSDLPQAKALEIMSKASEQGKGVITKLMKDSGRWKQLRTSDPKFDSYLTSLEQGVSGDAIHTGLLATIDAELKKPDLPSSVRMLLEGAKRSVLDGADQEKIGEKVSKAMETLNGKISARKGKENESAAKVEKTNAQTEAVNSKAESARKDAEAVRKQKQIDANIKNGVVDPSMTPAQQEAARAVRKVKDRQLRNDAIKNGEVDSEYLRDDPSGRAAAQAALDAKNQKNKDALSKSRAEAAKRGQIDWEGPNGERLEGAELELAKANAENGFIRAHMEEIKRGIVPNGATESVRAMADGYKKVIDERQKQEESKTRTAQNREDTSSESKRAAAARAAEAESKKQETERKNATSVYTDSEEGKKYLEDLDMEIQTNPDNLSETTLSKINDAISELKKPQSFTARAKLLDRISDALSEARSDNAKALKERAQVGSAQSREQADRQRVAQAEAKTRDMNAKADKAEEQAYQAAEKSETIHDELAEKLKSLRHKNDDNLDEEFGKAAPERIQELSEIAQKMKDAGYDNATTLLTDIATLNSSKSAKEVEAINARIHQKIEKFRSVSEKEAKTKKGKGTWSPLPSRDKMTPEQKAVDDKIYTAFKDSPAYRGLASDEDVSENRKAYNQEMKALDEQYGTLKEDGTTGMPLAEYEAKKKELAQKHGITIPDKEESAEKRKERAQKVKIGDIFAPISQEKAYKLDRDDREGDEFFAIKEWVKRFGDKVDFSRNYYDPEQGPNETTFRVSLNGMTAEDLNKQVNMLQQMIPGNPHIRIEKNGANEAKISISEPKEVKPTVSAYEVLVDPKTGKMRDEVASARVPLILGKGEKGKFGQVDLAEDDPHALIVGATKSGKTTLVQTTAAANAIKGNRTILLDGKDSLASEMSGIKGLHTFGSKEIGTALKGLISEARAIRAQLDKAGYRNVNDYNDDHPDNPIEYTTVIFDETPIAMDADPEIGALMSTITHELRSSGINMIALAQEMTAKNFDTGTRNQFGTKVVMKSDRVSGHLAGYNDADKLRGRGDCMVVKSDGTQERYQAPYAPPEDIKRFKKVFSSDGKVDQRPDTADSTEGDNAGGEETKNDSEKPQITIPRISRNSANGTNGVSAINLPSTSTSSSNTGGKDGAKGH